MESRFSFFIVFFLILTFGANSNALDSLRLETRDGRNFIIHEVEQGETLYGISRRYGANLSEVVRLNSLEGSRIELGQMLEIPTTKSASAKKPEATPDQLHVVAAKETLYGISKKYAVTIDEIKTWNGLPDNTLSLGQSLIVKKGTKVEEVKKPVEVVKPSEEKPVETKMETTQVTETKAPVKDDFTIYFVQTGDVLESIARRFNVRVDSIVIWNGMKNTYISIGQKLKIKGEPDTLYQTLEEPVHQTEYSKVKKQVDQSGFTRITEEGVAKKIEEIADTEKYLALHRTMKIGTLVEVRNLMNNKKIFVRIVGKLPETGLNENTLIRLSPICFKTLGIIDSLTRVEISYYEE